MEVRGDEREREASVLAEREVQRHVQLKAVVGSQLARVVSVGGVAADRLAEALARLARELLVERERLGSPGVDDLATDDELHLLQEHMADRVLPHGGVRVELDARSRVGRNLRQLHVHERRPRRSPWRGIVNVALEPNCATPVARTFTGSIANGVCFTVVKRQ